MIATDSIALHEAEAKEAAGAALVFGALVSGLEDHQSVELMADGNTAVAVPREALRLFAQMLSLLAGGSGVVVLPDHAELTTQQAADLINVSRPFLVKLIDQGQLPARLVGTHRRVLMSDVIAFKKLADVRGREALDDLAALSQTVGLDY